MSRTDLADAVTRTLAGRPLIWVGLRNDDAESLCDLPDFAAAVSLMGGLPVATSAEVVSYEELAGRRPDVETWTVDDSASDPAMEEFRRMLLLVLTAPSALVPYRSFEFLSSAWFTRSRHCVRLGTFGPLQSVFDHKPWVETELAATGIPTIPWTYVADDDGVDGIVTPPEVPIIVRRSRGSGGEGTLLIRDRDELATSWPTTEDGFVSVAPFFADAVPLNVGAVVWSEGVTVHHVSVQVTGIAECVTRPFGYCGSDFAAAAVLDRSTLAAIAELTVRVGDWLRRYGFIGAFGIDFLSTDGRLMFTELNPRFQGSTPGSCRLDVEADQPCLLLEHVAAHLGVPMPEVVALEERMQFARPLATVTVHQRADGPRFDLTALRRDLTGTRLPVTVDVTAPADVHLDDGAIAARVSIRDRVTDTGFDLRPDLASCLASGHGDPMRTTGALHVPA